MRNSSFGLDATTRATTWSAVKAGPSLEAVRAHVAKLASFPPARR